MRDAFEEGRDAFEAGLSREDNPYSQTEEMDEWGQWLDGFNDASFGD